MTARLLSLLLLVLAICGIAGAQGYRPKAGETVMKIEVEGRGDIFIKLHTREAPRTTQFVTGLVRQGFYDGLRFHRVERSPRPYLVQMGDPSTREPGKAVAVAETRLAIENTGFPHELGAVGLVRDRERPDSASPQFYIMLAPASFLDGNYTVFGKVVQGLDVLQKLERNDRVVSVTILSG